MIKQKSKLLSLIFMLCIVGTILTSSVYAGDEIPLSDKTPTDVKIFEADGKVAILDMSKIDAYQKFNLNFSFPWPENIPVTQAFIPKGVMMNAATLNDIDTSKANKGDLIEFTITDNVYLNGTLVIKSGTKGTAVVNYIKPPGRFLVDSVFSANVKETHTVNNITVPLMLEINCSGYNQPPLVTAVAISVYTVLVQGRYINIPAGTHFFVAVRDNVNLNTKLDSLYEIH